MNKLTFLGQTFDTDAAFTQTYPAYAGYIAMVRAGADTPHKVEVEIYNRNCRRRNKKAALVGGVKKRRKAA